MVPVERDIVLRDFSFLTGEKLAELRMHVMTLGTLRRDAKGHAVNAVLVMHGTTGSGQQSLRPQFTEGTPRSFVFATVTTSTNFSVTSLASTSSPRRSARSRSASAASRRAAAAAARFARETW